MVEYRYVPGLSCYYCVGDDGTVWSRLLPYGFVSDDWHQLVAAPDRHGHLRVTISSNGLPRKIFVHKLVLEAFTGPCPPGLEARHLNGDPEDNRVDNICWDTRAANMRDRVLHGGGSQGERNCNAILSDAKVISIRERWANGGISLAELAKEHGVRRDTIFNVVFRRTWTHVG